MSEQGASPDAHPLHPTTTARLARPPERERSGYEVKGPPGLAQPPVEAASS